MNRRGWIGSIVLLAALGGLAAGLTTWKEGAAGAPGGSGEPMEAVVPAVAAERPYRPTTTAIGTVVALRSVTLRNELAGTVREVRLPHGEIVDAGTVLVRQDVAVEEAELRALQARAALADAVLARTEKAFGTKAASALELDQARAERDVARAQVARLQAVIERKTIRAPFRARVGLSDVHPGQYLSEGTLLTTLQGVDDLTHVDFAVVQAVALGLRPGDAVRVSLDRGRAPVEAEVAAVDARVDATTRMARVRASVKDAGWPPGASVRVAVPAGPGTTAVAVPVSALRKGPEGDHVFVIVAGADGARASLRKVTGGPMLGDEVLILSGLKTGETVAAAGSFKLRDGVRVALPPAN